MCVMMDHRTLNEQEFDLFGDLMHLRTLSLLNVQFPTEALRIIPAMKELRNLEIESTAVRDDSINYLKNAKQLELLIMVGPKFSPEAIAELQANLPDCQINWDD